LKKELTLLHDLKTEMDELSFGGKKINVDSSDNSVGSSSIKNRSYHHNPKRSKESIF
jgi:hypothetical protein